MVVYKIRWPDSDPQRGDEHGIIEQKENGFSHVLLGLSRPLSRESNCRHLCAKEIWHIGKNSVMNNNQITKGKIK